MAPAHNFRRYIHDTPGVHVVGYLRARDIAGSWRRRHTKWLGGWPVTPKSETKLEAVRANIVSLSTKKSITRLPLNWAMIIEVKRNRILVATECTAKHISAQFVDTTIRDFVVWQIRYTGVWQCTCRVCTLRLWLRLHTILTGNMRSCTLPNIITSTPVVYTYQMIL